MIPYELLKAEAASHPYPLLFATISGAHLYGFPSPDSDFDLRGVHILPVEEAVGLLPKRETISVEAMRGAVELDLVTHDISKFFGMLLKRNGYVLEQLYSPLIVQTSAKHDELKQLVPGCITRNHAHHYLGFADAQWKLFRKEDPPRVKPLLYLYRVLLTGIHMMRTGRVEANLLTLNQDFRLPYIDELVSRKVTGAERSRLETAELDFHEAEYARLAAVLEEAGTQSSLPAEASCRDELNDLLVRIRLPL